MNDYWVVTDKTTGKIIAHCGEETDALMMVGFCPHKRTYRKQRYILDQVIDVFSTVDNQLPGQVGLPPAKEALPPVEIQLKLVLPESELDPVVV